MKIQGSVALVTGGASGLGEATVRRLVAAGGRAVIVDRDAAKGEALARELEGRAVFAPADVTSGDEVQAAVERAASLGALRIAVNCAGVGWAARTLARDGTPHDLELFRTVIQVNLVGTFNVLRLAAAAMAKSEALEDGERGVIVNTASVAAFDGQIGQIAYAASKGGVAAMTLPAARDLSTVGVRVVTIAPGTFDTPMLALLPEPARQAPGDARGVRAPRRAHRREPLPERGDDPAGRRLADAAEVASPPLLRNRRRLWSRAGFRPGATPGGSACRAASLWAANARIRERASRFSRHPAGELLDGRAVRGTYGGEDLAPFARSARHFDPTHGLRPLQPARPVSGRARRLGCGHQPRCGR
jgi:NAD(P)-dependent dehydrogenase (short-subunit alcohol dehydrogenase family)